MKRDRTLVSFIVAACGLLTGSVCAVMAQEDATEIVRRADQHMRGITSYVELSMKIVRPDWTREISMKSWSKGSDLALIYITAPARDQGTAFLKRKTEVWSWMPAVEKVIKIPPSMMMQSWMGSDFTNDDLVKESSIVYDYTHAIVGDSTIENRECWKIELVPLPDAAVVWGKIDVWISKNDNLELCADYFDEEGQLINTMILSEIRDLGGRKLPTVLKMIPVDKPKQYTQMTYLSAEWDKPIEDSFFSEQNMQRVR